MKRLIAAVLALCMLLGGCGVIRDNGEAGRNIPASTLDISNNDYTGRVEKLAVYFYNKTSNTLTAEVRTAVIAQDTNPAEIAVQELLKGPSNTDLLTSVAPDGMTLNYIEFSRNVANVYLSYSGTAMDPEKKYILEQAIANTVTDVLGATYISVFYNGTQSAFYPGIPYGPLEKQTGNVDVAWNLIPGTDTPPVPGEVTLSPAQSAVPTATPAATTEPAPKVRTISSVLYYISSDGNYILPEVHEVKYTDGDYIKSLITELVKGPQNTNDMVSPVDSDLDLAEDSKITAESDGSYKLTLDFTKEPSKNTYDQHATLLSYASIVYTVTGFLPQISSVEIDVNGKKAIQAGTESVDALTRGDFNGYIGSSAPVYFADKASDLLLQVSRSMEQGKIWSAKERVLELIKGPLSGEGDNASPVIPVGISDKDILSVNVYSDTAYVNLSKNFISSCAGLSSKKEMLLVYAIVNTITAMDGISKVQFLVEGQQANTLAGTICLTDPFLKNYGLIKENG